ncbi:MAG: CbrC family protein [Erysipelotrichaceae bacterium]|nr:CbrC family protein [Erysipelotrichaceae bacterium]
MKKISYKDYYEKDPKRYPFFRYHPDPIRSGIFVECAVPKVCQCCGKEETLICEGPFYSDAEVDCICPECIANGKAAKAFDMEYCEISSKNRIGDPEKEEELLHHSPGYYSYNGGSWLSHCNDYCIYEEELYAKHLQDRELMEELKNDPVWIEWELEDPEKVLLDRNFQIHLFSCSHCGKHLFYIDEFFD